MRRGLIGLTLGVVIGFLGCGLVAYAAIQLGRGFWDAETFVNALPCADGVPEPCRRVLVGRVMEAQVPAGQGAPQVRVSLPDGRAVQVTRSGPDGDQLVASLAVGQEVRVQTWRGEVVALRDQRGRVMRTTAVPHSAREEGVTTALLGLVLVGVGAVSVVVLAIHLSQPRDG